MSLFDVIYKQKFNLFDESGFDDFADRLSFKFSTFILMVASTIIIVKQYYMKPISCYIATETGGKYLSNYMEAYCWVEGTIPIEFFEQFPSNEAEWKKAEKKKILYYQWIPLILALQAVLCYLPNLLWRLFYITNVGKHMHSLISKANKAVVMDGEARNKEVVHLAKVLETILFETRDVDTEEKSNICSKLKKVYRCLVLGKRMGAYLIGFYWVIKILYLLNAIGQLLMMRLFLGYENNSRDFISKVLQEIINGTSRGTSSVFPIIGYCMSKVRHLGATNSVIAQCALPVNMLIERLYIFLWFWMLILAIITSFSIVIWIFKSYFQFNKAPFFKKYLKISNASNKSGCQSAFVKKFEKKFLKHNGMFLLRMIANSSGDLITAEVLNQLWCTYKKKIGMRAFKYSRKSRSIDENVLKTEKDCLINNENEKSKFTVRKISSSTATAPPLYSKVPNP